MMAVIWLAGIAIGTQAPLLGMLSSKLGSLESIFIVHLGGAVLSGIPLLFMAGGQLSAWASVPWYALLAGAFGVITIGAIGFAVPKLGVAGVTVVLIVGQLFMGALIDQMGWLGQTVRPLHLSKLLGFALLLLGAWLVVRPSS